MRIVLLFSCVLLSAALYSQGSFPSIPAQGGLKDLIPKGYDTLEVIRGDLDKDKVDDLVMVLRSEVEDEKRRQDSLPPRLLLIALKTGSSYKVVTKSDKAILCKDCGGVFGDPYAGSEIRNGVLSISFYGGSAWRWANTFKFRWQQGDMKMIGATKHSYWSVEHCDDLGDFAGTDYYDINYVTGSYEEKKISQECKLEKNGKGKKKVQPLESLSRFSAEDSF